jgi:signal recognition particle subunit SRP54
MMKKMGKGGMMKQAIAQMMGKGGAAGGMPDLKNMDPAQLEEAARAMKSGMGGMGGGLPRGLGGMGGLPQGLSGMFKKK